MLHSWNLFRFMIFFILISCLFKNLIFHFCYLIHFNFFLVFLSVLKLHYYIFFIFYFYLLFLFIILLKKNFYLNYFTYLFFYYYFYFTFLFFVWGCFFSFWLIYIFFFIVHCDFTIFWSTHSAKVKLRTFAILGPYYGYAPQFFFKRGLKLWRKLNWNVTSSIVLQNGTYI